MQLWCYAREMITICDCFQFLLMEFARISYPSSNKFIFIKICHFQLYICFTHSDSGCRYATSDTWVHFSFSILLVCNKLQHKFTPFQCHWTYHDLGCLFHRLLQSFKVLWDFQLLYSVHQLFDSISLNPAIYGQFPKLLSQKFSYDLNLKGIEYPVNTTDDFLVLIKCW